VLVPEMSVLLEIKVFCVAACLHIYGEIPGFHRNQGVLSENPGFLSELSFLEKPRLMERKPWFFLSMMSEKNLGCLREKSVLYK